MAAAEPVSAKPGAVLVSVDLGLCSIVIAGAVILTFNLLDTEEWLCLESSATALIQLAL